MGHWDDQQIRADRAAGDEVLLINRNARPMTGGQPRAIVREHNIGLENKKATAGEGLSKATHFNGPGSNGVVPRFRFTLGFACCLDLFSYF